MDRRLTLCAEGASSGSRYLVARASLDDSHPARPLSRIETAVVVRVLWGEQQKFVASELGIACSTASKWYTQALGKLHLDRGPVPAPLVIAAQAWASGKNPQVEARGASFVHEGSQYFVLSTPKPAVSTQGTLTPAECEVARFLIEGESRWDIAARRETSAQTVACQIRGIFSKWRLTGRYALIRRAAELGVVSLNRWKHAAHDGRSCRKTAGHDLMQPMHSLRPTTRRGIVIAILAVLAACLPGARSPEAPPRSLEVQGDPAARVNDAAFAVAFGAPQGAVREASEVSLVFNRPLRPLEIAGEEEAASPARIMSWRDLPTEACGDGWARAPSFLRRRARLPNATRYVVTVPAGTRALSGETLANAFR